MQNITEQCMTVGLCILATQISRFLPFAVFYQNRRLPGVISYLGKVLPASVFGMLLVYCCKDVGAANALPYFICIAATAFSHVLYKNMMVSIGFGTFLYVLLINTVFS
ncbi:MAG: branched-chain amino acid transporter permease [Succinivibrio sp.]